MKDGDPLGGRWRVEVDSPRRALPLTQMQSEMLRASVQRVGRRVLTNYKRRLNFAAAWTCSN